jgi:hypothetical protein
MRALAIGIALVGGCTGFSSVSNPDLGPKSPFAVVQRIPDAGALNGVWGSGPSDVHAVGDDGVILDYDGHTWTPVVGTSGASLEGVWGNGPQDIYAVGVLRAGERGIILHNDGTGWVEEAEVPTGLLSVWGVDDLRFAVGLDGVVYKKTSARDWYQLVTLAPNPNVEARTNAPELFSIWGNDATNVLVAGDVDTNFNFVGASMWVPLYDPVDRTRAYRAVWGPPGPSPNLFVGANYYGVWWFTGKDQALIKIHEEQDLPERAQQYFYGVWGFSSDRVVMVGSSGRIMTYDGGPGGLATVTSPTAGDLGAVWGSAVDDVWIVGADQLILHGKLSY